MTDPTPPLSPAASVDGLMSLARARAKAGDAEGAGRTFAAALHLAETHGLWGPTARAQTWLAGVDVRRGRLPLARQRLDHAWSLCTEHHLDAELQAEVAAQLGQVLVFQGHAGAGVALMSRAVGLWTELGRATERDELELALAAIHNRVDQAVRDATPGSLDALRAIVRRAEEALGLGRRDRARSDFANAWRGLAGASADPQLVVRVGLDYAQLLLADHSATTEPAQTVLLAVRQAAVGQPDILTTVDELLAKVPGPENSPESA